jgi:hypothetical protein
MKSSQNYGQISIDDIIKYFKISIKTSSTLKLILNLEIETF